jgi:hypothetical protein
MATRPQYSREVIGLSMGQMSDNEMFRPCSCLPAMEAGQRHKRRGTRTSEKGNDPFALRHLTVVKWRCGS